MKTSMQKLSKTLLIAAALGATAVSANAETYTGYTASSGTKQFLDGDVLSIRNFDTDPTWGDNSYNLGVAAKFSGATWDAARGAWVEKDGSSKVRFYKFDAVAHLSGNASITTTGKITVQGNSSHNDSSEEINGILYRHKNIAIALLRDRSSWKNLGNLVIDNSVDFVLLGNATIENDGEISLTEGSTDSGAYFSFGENTKFVNTVNASFNGEGSTGFLGIEMEFVQDARGENSGTMSNVEIDLAGNGIFENKGEMTNADIGFSGEFAGTAKFINRGEYSGSLPDFSIEDDDSPSSASKVLVENFGTMKTVNETGDDVSIYFKTNTDIEVFRKTLNNRYEFINRGVICAAEGTSGVVPTFSVESFIDLTLSQGSRIEGNLRLGGEVTGMAYVNGYKQNVSCHSSSEPVLKIILNDLSSNQPLIAGDLILADFIDLKVVSEGTRLKYSVDLWGDQVVVDEDPVCNIPSSSSAFLQTSGTFVQSGQVFDWSLDTSTGILTAKSQTIGDEYVANNADENFTMGSRDRLDFGSALSNYAGTVSGKGGIYSDHNLAFSGSLENFEGTLYVDAGTFSAESGAKLGKGEIEIADGAKLAIAPELTIENPISGNGEIVLAESSSTEFKSSVSVGEMSLTNATVKGTEIDIDTVEFSGSNVTAEKLDVSAGTIAGSNLTASDTIRLGEVNLSGTTELTAKNIYLTKTQIAGTTTLSASDTIRLGEVNLSGTTDLTAKNIYLTKTQITGTTTLNCHSVLSNTQVNGGSLMIHDFRVLGSGTVNVIVDGAAGSRTVITHPADNRVPLVSGTADVSISNCDIKLTTYAREVVMFGAEVSSVSGIADIYEKDTPLTEVADEDKITVETPRGEGEYFYRYDEDDNIVLYGMLDLSVSDVLGYSAMPAMAIDVYNQDVASIQRNLRYRGLSAQKYNFFAEGHGGNAENDGLFEYNTYGTLVGADMLVAAGTVVGATVGYDFGKADIEGGDGEIEMDNYRFTAYFGKEITKKLSVSGGLMLGRASYDIDRDSESASTDATNVGLFARVSSDVLLTAATRMVPYIGVNGMISAIDDFSEGEMSVKDETVSSLRTTIGASFNYQMLRDLELSFDIAYTHEFLDDELDSRLRYGGMSEEVSEKIAEKDFVTFGLDANYRLSANARVFAGYSIDVGEDLAHRGRVGFNYSF